MKKRFFLIPLLCLLVCSCTESVSNNKIVGSWALKSITYQETLTDKSIEEETYIEQEYFGPYFEFFSNGSYSLFGKIEGKWHLINENRIHLEGGYEDGTIYIIVNVTNSELILERNITTNDHTNLKQIFYLYNI